MKYNQVWTVITFLLLSCLFLAKIHVGDDAFEFICVLVIISEMQALYNTF